MFSTYDCFLPFTGRIHRVERPEQGCCFEVYFLFTDEGRFVIKQSDEAGKVAELEAEFNILSHLQGRNLAVAKPLASNRDGDCGIFLFSYLEGTSLAAAVQSADRAERMELIADYARALKTIHQWNPGAPRQDYWLDRRVRSAISNLEEDFDRDGFTPYSSIANLTAAQVVAALPEWREGLERDDVFGHGDYCLPNVLMNGRTVSGLVDWSAGGYLDRRFDLATAALSIRYNLRDEEYVDHFLASYGYPGSTDSLRVFEALYVLV